MRTRRALTEVHFCRPGYAAWTPVAELVRLSQAIADDSQKQREAASGALGAVGPSGGGSVIFAQRVRLHSFSF
jgi:hypothetical protein